MKYLICAIAVTTLLTVVSAEKTTLYVGALLELSNHWYQKYVNFFGIILEHVFEEVDNRTDILSDYSLKLIKKDTEVSSDFLVELRSDFIYILNYILTLYMYIYIFITFRSDYWIKTTTKQAGKICCC